MRKHTNKIVFIISKIHTTLSNPSIAYYFRKKYKMFRFPIPSYNRLKLVLDKINEFVFFNSSR